MADEPWMAREMQPLLFMADVKRRRIGSDWRQHFVALMRELHEIAPWPDELGDWNTELDHDLLRELDRRRAEEAR